MGACWTIKECKEKVKVKSKVAILGFIMKCDSKVPALQYSTAPCVEFLVVAGGGKTPSAKARGRSEAIPEKMQI